MGDALGAPCETTDDTQMAALVAESLLERNGLELPDVFHRSQSRTQQAGRMS